MAAYVPPSGSAIAVTLSPGYTPPSGNALAVVLGANIVTSRSAYASVAARFGRAAKRSSMPMDSHWGQRPRRHRALAAMWSRPMLADQSQGQLWGRLLAADQGLLALWQAATTLASQSGGGWRAVKTADHAGGVRWTSALAMPPARIVSSWLKTYVREQAETLVWTRAKPPALIYQPPSTEAYVPPPGAAIQVVMYPGYSPPAYNAIAVVLVGSSHPAPVVVRRADPSHQSIRWGLVAIVDASRAIPWGRGSASDSEPVESPWTGSPDEPPPIPVARRVYIVMNEVQVVRLPERTPIEVNAVDLSATVDAWCWSLRMELADPSQWSLLKPDGNGPKLVEITMNSYVWTAIIEDREGMRVHASRNVTVTGRSQTALLSETYAASRSLAVGDARSAQQLANLELTDRAAPFTIDWQGLDWVVPGGNWYYQDLAPMAVISQIAAARGAVVQSAPGDARLIVQSRYPVSPWNWTPAASDVVLPIDWCTDETVQQQSKPMYDAVIIAGTQQGVLAKVSRQGSAASTFATQVVDQLIVTPDVATERGRNVLADRGMQWQVDLQIPLHAPGNVTAGMSGLYAPLLLVDVQDPDDPYQAQSVGVTISARRGGDDDKTLEIWQRVSLERHLSDAN